MRLMSGTQHISITVELTARMKEGMDLIIPGAVLKGMDLGIGMT